MHKFYAPLERRAPLQWYQLHHPGLVPRPLPQSMRWLQTLTSVKNESQMSESIHKGHREEGGRVMVEDR